MVRSCVVVAAVLFGCGSDPRGERALHVADGPGAPDERSTAPSTSPPVAALAPLPLATASVGGRPLMDFTLDATASTCDGGPCARFAWSFGDGADADGAGRITHRYAVPGQYTVRVVVTDASGRTAAAEQRVGAESLCGPIGIDGTPAAGPAPLTVRLVATPCDGGGTATYAWDLGDGATGDGGIETHTFAAPGTYEVALTRTDPTGHVTAGAVRVLVGAPPPAACADLVPAPFGVAEGYTTGAGTMGFWASAALDERGTFTLLRSGFYYPEGVLEAVARGEGFHAIVRDGPSAFAVLGQGGDPAWPWATMLALGTTVGRGFAIAPHPGGGSVVLTRLAGEASYEPPGTLLEWVDPAGAPLRSAVLDREASGLAVARSGDVLVLAAGDGAAAARWYGDRGEPLTGWFTVGPTPAAGEGTSLTFSQTPVGDAIAIGWGGAWTGLVPDAAARVDAAPAWLAERPGTRFVAIRGGRAYAVLGASGADALEIVTSDGVSCGAFGVPGLLANDPRSLEVGPDGTVLQALAPGWERGFGVAHAWRWWPGLLR